MHQPAGHSEHEWHEHGKLFDDCYQLDNVRDCPLPIFSLFLVVEQSIGVIFQIFGNAIGGPREEVDATFKFFARLRKTAELPTKEFCGCTD